MGGEHRSVRDPSKEVGTRAPAHYSLAEMAVPLLNRGADLREHTEGARREGRRVAFVPTMGALHEGHVALIEHARSLSDLVVVSIFVNPTQFAPGEDFDRYPRTLEADMLRIEAAVPGDRIVVFAPDAAELYPPGDTTRVHVGAMSEVLCGPHRPGHFEGVATVVTKFFGLVGASVALFGKKDYQQLQILRRVTLDLLLPVTIVAHPTVREADGMAKSSRNRFLSPTERTRARSISAGLAAAHAAFTAGERRVGALEAALRGPLSALDSLDYAALADPDTLQALAPERPCGDRVLAAVAGHLGRTRLIDNIVLGEDPAPAGAP